MATKLMDYVLNSAGGKFGPNTDSQSGDVARILDLAVQESPAKGLVVHFHGGLVNKANGMAVATKLLDVYRAAKTYPLFFVWEAGFTETLLNNKDELAKDPAFQELIKKASEWVLKRIGGSVTFKGTAGQDVDVEKLRQEYNIWFSGGRTTPPVPDHEVTGAAVATKGADAQDVDDLATLIESQLDDDHAFKRAIEEAYNAQLPNEAIATKGAGSKKRAAFDNLSEAAKREIFPSPPGQPITKGGVLTWFAVAKFVAKIVLAVLKRYGKGRDHGVYCTIVEEVLRSAYGDLVGSGVWGQMKKDTADSFQTGAEYCGTGVINCLKSLEVDGKGFPQITLVGHSTGAIYICNFLDAAEAAGLKCPIKVIFLAPAVTHARFAQAIKKHANTTRISDFRQFAMQDATECEDKMLSIVYTRSLLYFVSGLTEGEVAGGEWQGEFDMSLVGMERYLKNEVYSTSEFGEVKIVKDFLKASPSRLVLSPATGAPGFNSQARHHGDFDDDAPTRASMQAFI